MLSRHGASQATGLESVIPGRTFTDWIMCTKGEVLCALPTLIANGLLNGAESLLGKIKGYYTTVHILLLLAFMALCRIKTTEKIRGQAPGEFGKMIGLDRIPEVRCLRHKMDELCAGEKAELWAAHISKYWMESEPEAVGALYIDGHVRVYHGHLLKMAPSFFPEGKES